VRESRSLESKVHKSLHKRSAIRSLSVEKLFKVRLFAERLLGR
jgi:hypothetical protein